ncbi:MAG: hypothetical protein IPO88_05160 [Nannocystis sp.]|uniref:tetratricopeptide repeat protein n=1 Tax=Nannocystis sp. TaxID=1962667 RepID=UPI00242477A4|nr:tetratricopeptide repeat protein [Nannocystis sp.]MBK9752889.1 hypothetical protein [Nannocystis sp.]
MTAAAKFAAKGQHDRAAKEYVSVIEADPSDTRTWLLLAEALVNAGDKPGAIERYLHVAAGYASTNDAQKAIAVYRKVLGIDANRLDIQTRIAGLYKDLGRVGDAVAAYEFVAQAYFQAGQIAEGLEGFRMVAELEPAAVGKRLRLAELYSREGMVAQAVEHFRLAAERLLADRRTDDYIRVAERLIYHKEDDLPVLRSLAQIYLRQNENRRALVKLNALLRAAPADAEGLELLGETFVAIGKVDKAISVVMELAREQRKGGRKNKETAARVLRKALQWNPENADDIRKLASEIEAEVALLPPDAEPKDKGELDLDVDVVEDEAAASSGDIDLDVDVEDVEVKVEEVPSRPFAPVGANVAPSVVEAGDESVGDVDKVLLEARVYVKYKMFEHALGHLDAVFLRDSSHLGALELQAQILVELDRRPEAADILVRLAQLVSARDPRQARANLEQAQKLVPDHTKAEMVLAALDSGGIGETAPLLIGLQAELQGDPTAPPRAFDPAESSSHGAASTVGPEPSGTVPVAVVAKDSSEDAKPVEAPGAPSVTSEGPAVQSLARDEVPAATPPAEGSGARTLPTISEDSGAGKLAALVNEPRTEGSGARKLPTEEGSGARKPVVAVNEPITEGSGARKLPTVSEGSGARKLPTEEGSGARKLAALVNEPITEGSVARKLPTERTPLPIKTFGEKTPLPVFKPPPSETVIKAASETDSSGTLTGTPEPAAPVTDTPPRGRPIVKPVRKPPGGAFKPPAQPSAEVEELDSGVIEELDVDEADVVETPAAPPPRKGPPSRPAPPAKRPPPKPPGRSDPKAASPSGAGKATPVPEDSKATPVPEDSKATPVPEDSKATPVPEDSKATPVPEDSKATPVPEDSKAQALPITGSEAVVEAQPAEVVAESRGADSRAVGESVETRPEPVAAAEKAEPASAQSETVEPVSEPQPAAEVMAAPVEPTSETPAAAAVAAEPVESAGEAAAAVVAGPVESAGEAAAAVVAEPVESAGEAPAADAADVEPVKPASDGSTHDGSTHDGSTHDGSTHDGSTRDGSTRDGSTHDGSTHDGSTRDGSRGAGARRARKRSTARAGSSTRGDRVHERVPARTGGGRASRGAARARGPARDHDPSTRRSGANRRGRAKRRHDTRDRREGWARVRDRVARDRRRARRAALLHLRSIRGRRPVRLPRSAAPFSGSPFARRVRRSLLHRRQARVGRCPGHAR